MKKKTIMGLEYKWEMLLVYIFPILGLIFSFMKDKEVSDDVRFQYNQAGAIFIVNVGLNIVSKVLISILSNAGIPVLPTVLSFAVWAVSIAIFVFEIITVVKAFSDETYEIPAISNLAKAIWKK